MQGHTMILYESILACVRRAALSYIRINRIRPARFILGIYVWNLFMTNFVKFYKQTCPITGHICE